MTPLEQILSMQQYSNEFNPNEALGFNPNDPSMSNPNAGMTGNIAWGSVPGMEQFYSYDPNNNQESFDLAGAMPEFQKRGYKWMSAQNPGEQTFGNWLTGPDGQPLEQSARFGSSNEDRFKLAALAAMSVTGANIGLANGMFGGATNAAPSGAQAFPVSPGGPMPTTQLGSLTSGGGLNAGGAVSNAGIGAGTTTGMGGTGAGLSVPGLASGGAGGGSMFSSGLGDIIKKALPSTAGGWGQLAEGLAGVYSGYESRKDAKSTLEGMSSNRGAYEEQLRKNLQRVDAARGRRSDFGGREVELQARLAELDSRNMPAYAQLSQMRSQGLMDMLGSGLRYGGKAGWFGDEYNPSKQVPATPAGMPSNSAPPAQQLQMLYEYFKSLGDD